MTKYLISTPVAGFTGVSVGVNFTDGQAEIDSEAQTPALAYFRAQGYGVDEVEAPAEPEPTVPPENTDPVPPAGNASEAEWREYLIALGATEEQVKDLKRDQLKDVAAKVVAEKQKEQTA